MKPIITLLLVAAIFSAQAQSMFKPAIEAYDGLKTKGFNIGLLPNKSFFMIELGAQWADYGGITDAVKGAATPGNTVAYSITIGGSIFDGTYSPVIDAVPFAFMAMNGNIAAGGGGIKLLRNIDALNLYAGGYAKYTFSDNTRFFDAGLSINYYFAR